MSLDHSMSSNALHNNYLLGNDRTNSQLGGQLSYLKRPASSGKSRGNLNDNMNIYSAVRFPNESKIYNRFYDNKLERPNDKFMTRTYNIDKENVLKRAEE